MLSVLGSGNCCLLAVKSDGQNLQYHHNLFHNGEYLYEKVVFFLKKNCIEESTQNMLSIYFHENNHEKIGYEQSSNFVRIISLQNIFFIFRN